LNRLFPPREYRPRRAEAGPQIASKTKALPALRRNSAPFSKMNGSRNHIVIVFAATDASFPRAGFESAKWGGLNLKNKESNR